MQKYPGWLKRKCENVKKQGRAVAASDERQIRLKLLTKQTLLFKQLRWTRSG
jgi:hypothetical protein